MILSLSPTRHSECRSAHAIPAFSYCRRVRASIRRAVSWQLNLGFRGSLKLLTSVSTSVLWPHSRPHAALVHFQMFLPRARTFCIPTEQKVDTFSLGRTWTWFVSLYRLLASFPGLSPFLFFVKPLFCSSSGGGWELNARNVLMSYYL